MKNFIEKYSVGQQIELKRDIDRLPHFVVAKGTIGTVCIVYPEQLWVKMDKVIKGAKIWGNCIVWDEDSLDQVEDDIKILPQN